MKLIEKLSSTETIFASLERLVKWLPLLLGTSLTSYLGAWSSATTLAFQRYSPFSWIFGGLVGAGMFIIFYWLWTQAKLNLLRIKFSEEHSTVGSNVNPLDDVFTKLRINLNVFRQPFNEPVIGKNFINCELSGPIIIILYGHSTLANASLHGCEFVKIKDRGFTAPNCVPFVDVHINGGKMFGVTILVPESGVSLVNKGFNNGIDWITH